MQKQQEFGLEKRKTRQKEQSLVLLRIMPRGEFQRVTGGEKSRYLHISCHLRHLTFVSLPSLPVTPSSASLYRDQGSRPRRGYELITTEHFYWRQDCGRYIYHGRVATWAHLLDGDGVVEGSEGGRSAEVFVLLRQTPSLTAALSRPQLLPHTNNIILSV